VFIESPSVSQFVPSVTSKDSAPSHKTLGCPHLSAPCAGLIHPASFGLRKPAPIAGERCGRGKHLSLRGARIFFFGVGQYGQWREWDLFTSRRGEMVRQRPGDTGQRHPCVHGRCCGLKVRPCEQVIQHRDGLGRKKRLPAAGARITRLVVLAGLKGLWQYPKGLRKASSECQSSLLTLLVGCSRGGPARDQ
jgi:hypothetical protein